MLKISFDTYVPKQSPPFPCCQFLALRQRSLSQTDPLVSSWPLAALVVEVLGVSFLVFPFQVSVKRNHHCLHQISCSLCPCLSCQEPGQPPFQQHVAFVL